MNMKLKKKLEETFIKYKFSPKPFFSQNFLIDERIVLRIVEEIAPGEDDFIVEVGAGTGILTSHLVKKAKKVLAIEIDRDLCRILEDELGENKNLIIMCEDIKKIDLDRLFPEEKRVKIVGNLPYYFISDLLLTLAEKKCWKEMILTVQREVAERIFAPPGSKKRGFLTLALSLYAQTERIMDIPPQAFYPPPRVSSTVVRMKPSPQEKGEEKIILKVVKAAFSSRRKTLLNALCARFGLPRNVVEEALEKSKVPENLRAEMLKLEDFKKIALNLKNFLKGGKQNCPSFLLSGKTEG
ncbi:ribosomal RNA small subunit methyltransferase A [Candidatus Aerophobetes bacterium]|nr:ribosomal RNA small subunit methyltransferase A [Candidatus Aerophobetes bacterium]